MDTARRSIDAVNQRRDVSIHICAAKTDKNKNRSRNRPLHWRRRRGRAIPVEPIKHLQESWNYVELQKAILYLHLSLSSKKSTHDEENLYLMRKQRERFDTLVRIARSCSSCAAERQTTDRNRKWMSGNEIRRNKKKRTPSRNVTNLVQVLHPPSHPHLQRRGC